MSPSKRRDYHLILHLDVVGTKAGRIHQRELAQLDMDPMMLKTHGEPDPLAQHSQVTRDEQSARPFLFYTQAKNLKGLDLQTKQVSIFPHLHASGTQPEFAPVRGRFFGISLAGTEMPDCWEQDDSSAGLVLLPPVPSGIRVDVVPIPGPEADIPLAAESGTLAAWLSETANLRSEPAYSDADPEGERPRQHLRGPLPAASLGKAAFPPPRRPPDDQHESKGDNLPHQSILYRQAEIAAPFVSTTGAQAPLTSKADSRDIESHAELPEELGMTMGSAAPAAPALTASQLSPTTAWAHLRQHVLAIKADQVTQHIDALANRIILALNRREVEPLVATAWLSDMILVPPESYPHWGARLRTWLAPRPGNSILRILSAICQYRGHLDTIIASALRVWRDTEDELALTMMCHAAPFLVLGTTDPHCQANLLEHGIVRTLRIARERALFSMDRAAADALHMTYRLHLGHVGWAAKEWAEKLGVSVVR